MLRRKKSCFKKNFTLIELLVSLAVFSILLLIMLQFFSGAQRIWVASENRNNLTADARVALQVIGDLLLKAYPTAATAGTSTDVPFVVDRTTTGDNKLYFITDSLYQFASGANSNLYFVMIYRDTTVNELRITAASDAGVAQNCFDGTTQIIDGPPATTATMVGALNNYSTGNYKTIIPRVVSFNVTGLNSSGAALGTNVTVGYPYVLHIELVMLSDEDYKKWIDLGGGSSETTEAKTFRELVQQTFTKTVFLGKQSMIYKDSRL